MRPNLAPGAEFIWDMRMQGKKPAGLVLVSCIGELPEQNLQVLAPRGKPEDFDWRWVFDLSVCVVYDSKTPAQYRTELFAAILRCAPNGGYVPPASRTQGYLWTWDADQQTGHQLDWWAGYDGIPELGIKDEPERIDTRTLSRFERMNLKGLGL